MRETDTEDKQKMSKRPREKETVLNKGHVAAETQQHSPHCVQPGLIMFLWVSPIPCYVKKKKLK